MKPLIKLRFSLPLQACLKLVYCQSNLKFFNALKFWLLYCHYCSLSAFIETLVNELSVKPINFDE